MGIEPSCFSGDLSLLLHYDSGSVSLGQEQGSGQVVSWKPQPGAMATDALSLNWKGMEALLSLRFADQPGTCTVCSQEADCSRYYAR